MEISLSTDIDHISWQEMARLFELAPLGKKREPEKVEIAFRNSLLRVFSFHGTTLVGAGRRFLMACGVPQFMTWQSCQSTRVKESEA